MPSGDSKKLLLDQNTASNLKDIECVSYFPLGKVVGIKYLQFSLTFPSFSIMVVPKSLRPVSSLW